MVAAVAVAAYTAGGDGLAGCNVGRTLYFGHAGNTMFPLPVCDPLISLITIPMHMPGCGQTAFHFSKKGLKALWKGDRLQKK